MNWFLVIGAIEFLLALFALRGIGQVRSQKPQAHPVGVFIGALLGFNIIFWALAGIVYGALKLLK